MPVIDTSVRIGRPAAEVFTFLITATNLPRWDSSILQCVQLDAAPVAVGTRYRGSSKILGRRLQWTTEVVEFVPGVRSVSRSVDGPLTFTVSYDLTEADGATHLRYRLEADSGLGGAFGRALEPIVEKAQAKVVAANLHTLTGLLEQHAA